MKNSIIFILMLINGVCFSQNEKIKNKQRAILIYNFSQQVTWPNPNEFENFTIGVLGQDPVLAELKAMENNGRTVKGKKIVVLNLSEVEDIENIQMVYVNRKFNFDMKELLQKVRGKHILIASEDYGFNESMINMINIDDNFQFEINKTRLNRENLSISTAFAKMAITSAARWQELYRQSAISLKLEKERVLSQKKLLAEQRILLEKQKNQINEQIHQIDQRNLEIERQRLEYDSLGRRNNRLRVRYRQDSAFQIQLHSQLENQRIEIEDKKKDLAQVDQELRSRNEELQFQEEELEKRSALIKEQDSILRKQREEINYQRNFTILFILISFFVFVAGFFIWRSYRIKKKSEKELKLKNEEIEKQKKELEFRSKESEEFAYIASHDLQAPLNSMNALASLLLMGDLNDDAKENTQLIVQLTDKMKKLIRGLLEYSQLGKAVEFSTVDCNFVAKSAIDNLDQIIKENEATVTIAELPSIEGHEIKLILLFQNLIGNAIKFKKPGVPPEVRISAEKVKDENTSSWKFEIRDNGIGIAPEAQDRIFAIFQRLHNNSQYEGTGIGLAHCKKIVDLHGGKIWVESEVGKGSSFYFTI
ncbi:MAG: YfiR/HmsC family protein [Bacteroidota bacterium]